MKVACSVPCDSWNDGMTHQVVTLDDGGYRQA